MITSYVMAWFLYAYSPDGGVRHYGPYIDEADCRKVQTLKSNGENAGEQLFPYMSACVQLKVPK